MAHIRALAGTDPTDKMAMIALLVRGYELWVRNGAYPDMAKTTIVQLFNDNDEVRNELLSRLGFDVTDALAVLTAVHHFQLTALNERFQAMRLMQKSDFTSE
ncbi:hypothetical protein [Frankia tisae]|uniref:hypothetical protein n=1 Tax=Frankia tisae TaxID=2950104 RepID=UPI0021C22A57|nr:hypothetical protein [Frankia tisae]